MTGVTCSKKSLAAELIRAPNYLSIDEIKSLGLALTLNRYSL